MLSAKIAMKMLADMAGVTPEQIAENFAAFQAMAIQGVATLERIDVRLAAIEQTQMAIAAHLDIPVIIAHIHERQNDGEKIGITSAA